MSAFQLSTHLTIHILDIPIEVVRDETVRLSVISRVGWIRRQQAAFARQERQSAREMVTGESHYVQGHRYRLDVAEHNGPPAITLRTNRTLELRLPPTPTAPNAKPTSTDGIAARCASRFPPSSPNGNPSSASTSPPGASKR